MKVVGEATVRGSVETVWDALHDAAILARAIPGCEHFEISGPGLAEFTASAVLPAIRGTYVGKLTITEQQRPNLLRLTASATSDLGTVAADMTLRLSEAAGVGPGGPTPLDPPDIATTLMSYEANGTVTGSIAGVGTRLLAGAAKRLAGEFFAVIDQSVAAPAATPSVDAAVVEADTAELAPRALARPGPLGDSRAALVAGAAIGLAGVIIGVLAGRRSQRAGRVRA